jgi:UDP-N-acetylglucosamine--N-acetylmuramyl-(pentapeptide) pyrophosphoryl-undecaprenol N-acetylglucosamine transferase
MMTNASSPLIALVAGGTGGHIFPALAVARELMSRGYRALMLTDDRGAAYLQDQSDVHYQVLDAADPRGGTARALLALPAAVLVARRALKELAPAAAIGFGGYATLPVMLAARLQGLPTCLHEQNAVLGRVNRLMARFVDCVALTYEQTNLVPSSASSRCHITGNPVRAGLLDLRQLEYEAPTRDGDINLLVIGGSQGAATFSNVVPAALWLLPTSLRQRIRLTMQCRPETLDAARATCTEAGIQADLATFFTDMPDRLKAAHLVIARSGASSVSELQISGRPGVFVPLPYAMDDHQTANARPVEDAGAGWLVPELVFTVEGLFTLLSDVLGDATRLVQAAAAMRSLARPEATNDVASLIEAQLAQQGHQPVAEAEKPSGTTGGHAFVAGGVA